MKSPVGLNYVIRYLNKKVMCRLLNADNIGLSTSMSWT